MVNAVSGSASAAASADPAAEFFKIIVEPTVGEFLARPDDARLGCLACLVLASMADHYFHAREKPVEGHIKEGKFRFALGEAYWPFKQVLAVANATKHVLPHPDRLGFGQIKSDEITVDLLRCDWPINGRYVMIEAKPDEPWLLYELVALSRDMWCNKLVSTAPPPRFPDHPLF